MINKMNDYDLDPSLIKKSFISTFLKVIVISIIICCLIGLLYFTFIEANKGYVLNILIFWVIAFPALWLVALFLFKCKHCERKLTEFKAVITDEDKKNLLNNIKIIAFTKVQLYFDGKGEYYVSGYECKRCKKYTVHAINKVRKSLFYINAKRPTRRCTGAGNASIRKIDQ